MLTMSEQRRPSRKLVKRRKNIPKSTINLPERFKDGADAQEDYLAPKSETAQIANQPVFSMIAAVGSKTDFHTRFGDVSDSEEDDAGSESSEAIVEGAEKPRRGRVSVEPGGARESSESRHGVFRSTPQLQLRIRSPKPPRPKADASESTSAVVETYTAHAEMQMPPHVEPRMGQRWEKSAEEDAIEDDERRKSSMALATRLKEIFELADVKDVIAEYPCWLLKSVLLQGYMYITDRHILFYAYLPKKSNVVIKSGHLSKRGRQNPRYTRYWFTLKGSVLSYYADPSNLYFPSNTIDLTYSTSAGMSESKEHGKDPANFYVTTHLRKHYFRADSAASAKEWVKTLQRVIFRSHNDGDSVKIAIPLENVIDIEDSPVLEFAETIMVRVVDNDETYAIDEFYFSFFKFGPDALKVLHTMVNDAPARRIYGGKLDVADGRGRISPGVLEFPDRPFSLRAGSPGTITPLLQDSVKATLSSRSPVDSPRGGSPRPSGEFTRQSSDRGRPSLDHDGDGTRSSSARGRARTANGAQSVQQTAPRRRGSSATRPEESSDSYVLPSDREADAASFIDEVPASGSQILSRSDVFSSPTIQRRHRSGSPGPRRSSTHRSSGEVGRRSDSAHAEIRVEPPSRSQTQGSLSKPVPISHSGAPDDMGGGVLQRPSLLSQSNSSATLQELVKAGAYPLQRAAGFAGFLKNRSKRMSSLLATESMGYMEKVSGMWVGGRRHYSNYPPGLSPDDRLQDPEEGDEVHEHGDRFRAHFALPPAEKLQATFFGYLHRVLPLYGKIYVSNRSICFRSLLPGTRTKMILPLKNVENVEREKGFCFGYSGLVIVVRAHEELFFEFGQAETRDDFDVTILRSLDTVRHLQESGVLSQEERESAEAAKAEHRSLLEARQDGQGDHAASVSTEIETAYTPSEPTVLFDDPRASIINFTPTTPLRITCLTIGSRGDVQPYIALCKGLLAEGHRPKIATHAEFGDWVRGHGIEFAPVEGDPAELMRICVENGMFTYSFMREASSKFRGWIDDLLSSAWKACQDTDVLIESPSAMAGIHIAEALGIPYFRAFTMPWTRTRAYPHAFAVPDHKMGGAYNYFTYVMFDNVFWKAIAGQVNRWRKNELSLGRTSLDKLQPNKVPFLYNFSPSVVVPPLDYSDWIRVTGYWFLNEASDWSPPEELVAFIQKARRDEKRIVYVGFGSIVVSDPAALTRTIIESVQKADVRCILSKGWSDRLGGQDASKPETPLPSEIFQIKSAPHDWLFARIDAAAHHGGAGTTGASLRAGLPTIIKPFFGDQFFFGSRVEDLGVGICIKRLNVSVFSQALWLVTQSQRIIIKAKALGEQIRKEDGVGKAIQSIYRDLEYARSLIKKRGADQDDADDDDDDDDDEDTEESWTFIGDDSDAELVHRMRDAEPARSRSKSRGAQGETSRTGSQKGRESSPNKIMAS